jgi:hypothetical protein
MYHVRPLFLAQINVYEAGHCHVTCVVPVVESKLYIINPAETGNADRKPIMVEYQYVKLL